MDFFRYEQTLTGLNEELRGPLNKFNGVRFDVRGTFVGTLVFEVTQDDVNWTSLTVMAGAPLTTPSLVTSITGVGNWFTPDLTGFTQFRIRCSAYTSGTINVIAVVTDEQLYRMTGIVGTANVQDSNAIFWNESATAQAISATVTGTSRDCGAASGAAMRYSAFNVATLADQAGTVRIEGSNDNTSWYRLTVDTAVAANTPVILSIPVTTRYHRTVYVNGGVAQTLFRLNSSYTPA